MQRYFINQVIQSVGEKISVLKDQEHHMVKVMRMNVGECCEIVDEKEGIVLKSGESSSPVSPPQSDEIYSALSKLENMKKL